MFIDQSEISSDLEWILLSGQADPDMLMETLIKDHGQSIYQFLYIALLEVDLANKAMTEICPMAVKKSRSFHPDEGIFSWLLRVSVPIIRKYAVSNPVTATNSNPIKNPLDLTIANLNWKIRLALFVSFKYSFPLSKLGKILNVRKKWIEREFDKAIQELMQNQAGKASLEEIEQRIVETCESHKAEGWQVDLWLKNCHNKIAKQKNKPAISTHIQEALMISASISLILLVSWLYPKWMPDPEISTIAQIQPTLNSTQVSHQITEPVEYSLLPNESLEDLALQLNLSTQYLSSLNHLPIDAQLVPGQKILLNLGVIKNHLTTSENNLEVNQDMQSSSAEAESDASLSSVKTKIETLNRTSTPEEILARWQESQNTWQSLFIEGQWVDYGPFNYFGEAKSRRFQTWIKQPGSSLVKIGPLDSPPQETRLITSGMHISNHLGNTKQFTWWNEQGLPLAISDPLKTILSPHEFSQSLDRNSIHIIDADRYIGRKSITIEAQSRDQAKFYRLKVDAYSGIILNFQAYEPTSDILLAELAVLKIEYDPAMNDESLFDPLRLDETQFTRDFRIPFPEGQQISYGIEPIINQSTRQPQKYAEAPADFNPSTSQIFFQYSQELDPQTASPHTTQIIADGYLLGTIDFHPLEQINCRRSKSGDTLAFFQQSDYSNEKALGIKWLNLEQVDKIYQAMPDFEISDLTFRPDDKKLAVIGHPIYSSDTGLYILDHATGEYTLLLNLEYGSHIQWKPDGQYLSLLGKTNDQDQPAWMIIHIDSGLITQKSPLSTGMTTYFSSNLSPINLLPPPDFPIWHWGNNQNASYVGLEDCAFPSN